MDFYVGTTMHELDSKSRSFQPPKTTTSTHEKPTMDQAQDFKSLQDQIQDALITTTRTAGQISSEDLAFHRFLNPVVGTSLDEQSARLLALSNALLKSSASGFELRVPTLQEVDDVDSNWRNVIDVVDSLLEKADTCLDEYTGAIKRRDQPEQVLLCKLSNTVRGTDSL